MGSCIKRHNGAPIGRCVFAGPTQEGVATDTSINGADIVLVHPAGLTVAEQILVGIASGTGGEQWGTFQPIYQNGWAMISSARHSVGSVNLYIFSKLATAGDVAAGSTSFQGGPTLSQAKCGVMVRISGNDPSSIPNSGEDGQAEDSTTPYAGPSINTGESPCLAYYFLAVADDVVITVPVALVSDAVLSATDTNPCALALGHKAVGAAAATGAEDFTTPANESGLLSTVVVRGISQ